MNAKAIIPLVAGLGIAGLAAKLGLDFIKKAEGKQTQMVTLWTPIEDVKRGVAIHESMLKPLEFPINVVPAGALADIEKIKGRVPHTGAPAGVPVLDSMLLPPGVRPGIRVPPGLRAVAVKIDESSGVDNHLEPGCHVDVVGVFTVRSGNRAETVARTLLQNIEVAAVGERVAPSTPEPADEKGGKSSKRERPPRAVTLLVKPTDVPTLHLTEQKGKIKLSMRGVFDEGRAGNQAQIAEDDILGSLSPDSRKPEPTWRDKFDRFVGTFWNKGELATEPEPAPAEPAEPAAGQQPGYIWTVAVCNGDERRVWGFRGWNDFQPDELSSSEGPNIFEDQPKRPPLTPKTERRTDSNSENKTQTNPPQKTESNSQSSEKSNTDTDPEPNSESEPKELFE